MHGLFVGIVSQGFGNGAGFGVYCLAVSNITAV